jgi:hypothetical protein
MHLNDIDNEFLYEYILDEDLEGQKANRGEFIKNKMGHLWKGLHGFGPDQFDAFLDKLGEVDPSPKGIYMPWLAKLALTKPNENRAEDLDRVGQDLQAFEQFKRQIERKDINQYKSFQDLYDVVAPFLKPKKQTKDELAKARAAAELEKVKSDIITAYAGPEGWIRIPRTQAAATFLGQGTRWCTAAQKNNMFQHYAKDDNLFVVYDKASRERYQLHIQSGQFAGADDRNKGLNAVPDWARQPIVDYYKANNPQLTLKQIMSLSSYTDENLAKGTAHEDLISLMKQFGV